MSNEKMLTGREVDQKFGMYSGYVNHVRYAFPEYINAIRDPLKGGV